jgi:hypothetical protein
LNIDSDEELTLPNVIGALLMQEAGGVKMVVRGPIKAVAETEDCEISIK